MSPLPSLLAINSSNNGKVAVKPDFSNVYHIGAIMLCFSFLCLLFPISKILQHAMIKHCCKRITKSSKHIPRFMTVSHKEPLFIQSKIVLFISMSLYICYVLACSINSFIQFYTFHITTTYCTVFYIMAIWTFVFAKLLLLNYFVLRANDTFLNTSYKYNQCLIQSVLPFQMAGISIFLIPITYQFSNPSDIIISIRNTPYNGEYCHLQYSKTALQTQNILFMVGGCFDICFGFFALTMLLWKLLIVIQESSKDIASLKNSKINDENENNDGTNETNENDKIQISVNARQIIYTSNTNHMFNQRNECSDMSSLLPIQITGVRINDILNKNNGLLENEESTTEFQSIDPKDVCEFHTSTDNNNRLLLLITKLLILFMTQMVVMCIATVLYIVWTDNWIFYYNFVACVDVHCLFLTFQYNEWFYYQTCGGTLCTKKCFPFVKMCSLGYRCSFCQCWRRRNDDDGDDGYIDLTVGTTSTKSRRSVSTAFSKNSKFNDFCKCCFCIMRCARVKSSERRHIYLMAKSEIDLLLATKLQYKIEIRQDHHLWNAAVNTNDKKDSKPLN